MLKHTTAWNTIRNEFAGGLSVVEVFGDNIVDFQRIMKIVEDINANAMPMAA